MRKSPLDNRPERRPLRIFAFDPMISRAADHCVTVEVPYRPIEREERYFHDDRLKIVDYGAATRRYFCAIDLNDEKIAMTQGLEPSEQDPQFHQQMVYAVASKVLENFDRALGRRLRFRGGDRLRLIPHAFQARNAYFDDELNAGRPVSESGRLRHGDEAPHGRGDRCRRVLELATLSMSFPLPLCYQNTRHQDDL